MPGTENSRRLPTYAWPGLTLLAVVAAGFYFLHSQGRPWWCACGRPFLWSGEVQSAHNSQHLFDPYSFTHLLHGVLFYGMLAWCFPRWPLAWRFCGALSIELFWELLENSEMVINRYRTATIALGYEGDSIGNSLGDLLSCALGFWLAWRLGLRGATILFAATELVLVLWIRDSLVLSTLMLVWPLEALKAWQQAV